MAQYHKIPQNVITYQGRIIGNFTAKQFIFLAIGAIASFLIFQSPVPVQVKFVLIAITLGISLVFSVVNFQGRTTDAWIQSFFKSVGAPTQRIWRKDEYPPEFLLPGYHIEHEKTRDRQRNIRELERFIDFWRPATTTQNLSEEEKEVLNRIRKQRQQRNQIVEAASETINDKLDTYQKQTKEVHGQETVEELTDENQQS